MGDKYTVYWTDKDSKDREVEEFYDFDEALMLFLEWKKKYWKVALIQNNEEELADKEPNCNPEKLPDSEKALGPILSKVLAAQSVFYIDYDRRRSRARPDDMVIVETSYFEILLPRRTLVAHEDAYDEVGIELSPEDYGKRYKVFGWSLNKDELFPEPQDYKPTVSTEKNFYGDGRDWFRATFEEFPDMVGGIGRTEEEAVKAGYSILREELKFLSKEGFGFPRPKNVD